MISIVRPSAPVVDAYRAAKAEEAPTCRIDDVPGAGLHHDHVSRVIGHGAAAHARACAGLDGWHAHRGAGVEVSPADAEATVGTVVALVTRQAGLWVLAACRVESVQDGPDGHGFTYATLPDHPECGIESFTVRLVGDEVRFEIEAHSRPGIPLVTVGAPVARWLQHRAIDAYVAALERWVVRGGG